MQRCDAGQLFEERPHGFSTFLVKRIGEEVIVHVDAPKGAVFFEFDGFDGVVFHGQALQRTEVL
jgi:hypothetical protein